MSDDASRRETQAAKMGFSAYAIAAYVAQHATPSN
jgi:hypothetical protein